MLGWDHSHLVLTNLEASLIELTKFGSGTLFNFSHDACGNADYLFCSSIYQ